MYTSNNRPTPLLVRRPWPLGLRSSGSTTLVVLHCAQVYRLLVVCRVLCAVCRVPWVRCHESKANLRSPRSPPGAPVSRVSSASRDPPQLPETVGRRRSRALAALSTALPIIDPIVCTQTSSADRVVCSGPITPSPPLLLPSPRRHSPTRAFAAGSNALPAS